MLLTSLYVYMIIINTCTNVKRKARYADMHSALSIKTKQPRSSISTFSSVSWPVWESRTPPSSPLQWTLTTQYSNMKSMLCHFTWLQFTPTNALPTIKLSALESYNTIIYIMGFELAMPEKYSNVSFSELFTRYWRKTSR